MRLIDADKAREEATIDLVVHLLDRQPTIEAKPVVHAHWIKDDDGKYYCHNCGYPAEGNIAYYAERCPICGAQMDAEVFTAENPVVAEKVITDPPVATEEEKEKYLNKEIDYIKSYRIEEEHKYD